MAFFILANAVPESFFGLNSLTVSGLTWILRNRNACLNAD